MSCYFYATLQLHNLLESCSKPQIKSAMKKIFGFMCFVSDVISQVGLWPFWLRLPGPGPSYKMEVFCSRLY